MGYFSNGSEGDNYQYHYCEQCKNWIDLDDNRGAGCPIWDMHLSFNGNKDMKFWLDEFIPTKDGHNQQCRFYVNNGDVEGQSKLLKEYRR